MALLIAPTAARAEGAPAALLGKSIVASWTETRMQRFDREGPFIQRAIPQSLSVYISSEGRLFSRRSAVDKKGRTGSTHAVGSSGRSRSGGERLAQFSGGTLTVSASVGSGARAITISFNDNFSACTASVVLGRTDGQTIRITSLVSGRPLEIRSATTSGESCAIRNGNVFGD